MDGRQICITYFNQCGTSLRKEKWQFKQGHRHCLDFKGILHATIQSRSINQWNLSQASCAFTSSILHNYFPLSSSITHHPSYQLPPSLHLKSSSKHVLITNTLIFSSDHTHQPPIFPSFFMDKLITPPPFASLPFYSTLPRPPFPLPFFSLFSSLKALKPPPPSLREDLTKISIIKRKQGGDLHVEEETGSGECGI